MQPTESPLIFHTSLSAQRPFIRRGNNTAKEAITTLAICTAPWCVQDHDSAPAVWSGKCEMSTKQFVGTRINHSMRGGGVTCLGNPSRVCLLSCRRPASMEKVVLLRDYCISQGFRIPRSSPVKGNQRRVALTGIKCSRWCRRYVLLAFGKLLP